MAKSSNTDEPVVPNEPEQFTPKFVKDRYVAALRSTIEERKNFTLNHAYLLGKQWLWWNHLEKRIEEMPRDEDRVQATYDRLVANTATMSAKVLQQDMTLEVEPDGADDATILAAHTASSIVEATRIQHDWEHKREENFHATWEGGTSGVAIDWDPTAGHKIEENLYEGDTIETVLNITEFVVEPGTRLPEQARWWIKAQAIPPREVQARYEMDKEPPADASASGSPFNQRLMSNDLTPLTLVLTYYERPNYLSPNGRVAVVVDGQFVDGPKDWPFPFKNKLNLVVTRETPQVGKWTGTTRLSLARPVQALLNAAMSTMIEHMKLAGNARLMIPNSSADLVNQLDDTPGQPLFYNEGGSPPNYLSPPQMPAWENELPQQLMTQIDDIMGVPAISRGQTPSNAPESGYGLSILSEQADTPIGHFVKEQAIAWGKVATICLELFEDNVKESRTAVVRTPSQPSTTVKWSGKDLLGQTLATVPIDSVLPKSRAAMQAFAEKMLQMGLITSLPQLAFIAELPGTKDMLERIDPDTAKARRENQSFAEGKEIMPAVFDDDEKHIAEHLIFAKSPRFEAMSKKDQDLVIHHIQVHANNAAHKMGNAVARSNVSPALASVPRADGGPTLPPDHGMPPDPGMQTLSTPPGSLPESAPGAPEAAPPPDPQEMTPNAG